MTRTDQRVDALLRSRLLDAAGELGASVAARRRVTDVAVPRRSLRPLAAALALAVVAGAAGGMLARQLHHAAPAGNAAHHGRTTPSPSTTPSPTAVARRWPALFAHDDLSLAGRSAFGHLSLTGTDNTLAIGRYHLSVSGGPANPPVAPVWRYDRSAATDAGTLGERFGVTATPQADANGLQWPGISYDAGNGFLSYSSGTLGPGTAQLDAAPTDAASVARLAQQFLDRTGLLVDGLGAPQVHNVDQPNVPGQVPWSIAWSRSIAGLHLFTSGVSMGVDAQGNVRQLMVRTYRVAGGAPYPLIPWRQAWAQVSAGHWYAERGGFTGGNGQSSMPLFDATSVELDYLMPDAPMPGSAAGTTTESRYLVPMWMFTNGDGIALFFPAVASSDLTYTWAPKPWPSMH